VAVDGVDESSDDDIPLVKLKRSRGGSYRYYRLTAQFKAMIKQAYVAQWIAKDSVFGMTLIDKKKETESSNRRDDKT
jgi:hypothetical protein